MAKNPPILAVALLLLSTGAAAQTMRRTAHPQDTLQNTNGNLAPFGVHSTGFAGSPHRPDRREDCGAGGLRCRQGRIRYLPDCRIFCTTLVVERPCTSGTSTT